MWAKLLSGTKGTAISFPLLAMTICKEATCHGLYRRWYFQQLRGESSLSDN